MNRGREEADWKVSVVIPAYNAGAYIGRAIDSVLGQSHRADEIIVVDDGSIDHTADVVQGYGSKVRYIRQENQGASASRNTGIQAARNGWIGFLDGDDEWFTEKLGLQVGLLKGNPQLAWVSSNFIRCESRDNRESFNLEPSKGEALLGGREYFDDFFSAYQSHAIGCTDTMLIKRDVLDEAGLFRVGLKRVNDLDMWFRIAYRWPEFGYISRPLAKYYMEVPHSITKRHLNAELICELVDQHLALASSHGRLRDFEPCGAIMLRWWMHQLLESQQGRSVREILGRYGYLFSNYYKATTTIKSYFPRSGLLYDKIKTSLTGRFRSTQEL